jgi:DMSO/TMAO reductase YedYZ molybdopterin-dependent catalytic subunit
MNRRQWLTAGISTAAGMAGLTAAARIANKFGLIPPDHGGIYGPGEALTYASQRLLTRHSLAREFSRGQISNPPFANGEPLKTDAYQRLKAGDFAAWRLSIDGMVARPSTFSIEQLKAYSSSSQITHLACEEGWSFIAEWIGVPLTTVLTAVGIRPEAKFVVYQSLESDWWDSIDMDDALHPQTLIAYGLNGGPLPPGHGGPLRMRVPRHLGYKSVKYITKLTVTDSLKSFGKGLGSAAPEAGYSWYAGI